MVKDLNLELLTKEERDELAKLLTKILSDRGEKK